MVTRLFIFILIFSCSGIQISLGLPPLPKSDYQIIDNFSYADAAAHKHWELMAGTAPVTTVSIGSQNALKMTCNFQGTKIERASWDRSVKLDMTMCRGLQFYFYCDNTNPVSHFTVYLRSGSGWYSGNFDAPASKNWSPVQILKKDTNIEGKPAGWSKIETIRISAWRGRNQDTEFYIAALGTFGTGGNIVIIRGDSVADKNPSELSSVKEYTGVMAQFLERAGLEHHILSDLDVTAARLRNKKIVILPHNPNLPDKVALHIETYLKQGGKLIACYTLPKKLESVTGIRAGEHIRQKYKGYFTSIRPAKQPLKGMPPLTRQASWNIREASPLNNQSRIAAWWVDGKGESTGKPALLASNNCIFLTHVLISDDSTNKLALLLSMIGNLEPDLWRQAAQGCINRIGKFGPYKNYESAAKNLRRQSTSTAPPLDMASGFQGQATKALEQENFSAAIDFAEKTQKALVHAYCLAQKPMPQEHRAFWCHSAFGVAGMTWEQAIKIFADNGFTAIVPNMLWGGAAYYPSDVLPLASDLKDRGDQIALCLAACKKYGVECHVWKVNYNMGWRAPKSFMQQMKNQGRTQVSFDGTNNDRWLCPSHRENQKLEIESMLEVARKYKVHGVHFDYIRYPGRQGCFCKGCQQRFESAINQKVKTWPADIRSNDSLHEKWLDFRRQQITNVVAVVAQRGHKIRPNLKISAAVFNNWPIHRDQVGQDWKLWCEKGYLDFVCPMDYTPTNSHFQRMIEQQLTWAGKIPCYPGIGLSTWNDRTDIVKVIEQINITRNLKTGGFTIFNYAPSEARDILPLLGKGITRKK
jgi:uncharacterized lipoprotein YddW (UPF0748 family)